MKIITLASTKGGVGKTTASVFLAQALAHRGFKTLVVDLDPNNSLTDFFLRDVAPEQIEAQSVLRVLTNERPLEDCIFHHELSLSCLGATPELAAFAARVAVDAGALLRLSAKLKKTEFEVVVIDTPPSLGPLLTAGLLAADLVLSPVSPHRWILQAFAMLDRELSIVDEIKGKVPTRKTLYSMVTKTELDRMLTLGFDACRTPILKSESLKKAVDLGKPLKPATANFDAFLELSQEVLP